jgi:hypothetical protein
MRQLVAAAAAAAAAHKLSRLLTLTRSAWRHSTLFIVGPVRQCKQMVQPKRILSLVVFFACMALTLIVAVQGGIATIVPCLVFACCQFCAAVYYFMSFIVRAPPPQLQPLALPLPHRHCRLLELLVCPRFHPATPLWILRAD